MLQITIGKFDIGIYEEENYGYFEHHIFGDECGGGLWFESGELVDYDGTYVLPNEVAKGIQKLGYICDEEIFCDI